jgi:hypothetical protein
MVLKAIPGGKSGDFERMTDWPEPGEIAPVPASEPYPIDAFPPVARDAIKEFQSYGKQPMAMVGAVALGHMALPAQGLADVARDHVLISPVSLGVLTLGQSGERKTAVDGAFSRGARAWESEQRELLMTGHRKAMAIARTLDEREQSLIKKIGALEAKGGAEVEADRKAMESRLAEIVEQKQNHVTYPLPHLYFEDTTSEALSYHFGIGWPSAILASDEGGIVLGSRGMADETALGMFTLLNRLWDGKEVRQKRKQAKEAEIRGRRFSTALMIQPELLQAIIKKGGRAVGWFGRFLLAAPKTSMGGRLYSPPPENMPALTRYNHRARELLEIPLPVNDAFELEPPVMALEPAAGAIWGDYHDAVERELSDYGEFAEVRDIGAKSAENAARIACVFQIWDQGPGGSVLASHMEAGIAVASWHLAESVRVFFEAEKPQEIRDAELLSEWLITEGVPYLEPGGRMALNKILQFGPYRLRNRDRRNKALAELASDDVMHLLLLEENRRKMLSINPRLLFSKDN